MSDQVPQGQEWDAERSLPRPNSINLMGSLSSQSSSYTNGSFSSQSSVASCSQGQFEGDASEPDALPTPVEICLSQSKGQITSKNIDSYLCQLMGDVAVKDDQYHGFEVIGKVEKMALSDGESPSPGQCVHVVFSPMDGSPESNRPVLRVGSTTPDDAVFTVLMRSISKDGGNLSKPKEGASATPGSTGKGGATPKSNVDNVWAMYAEKGKLYILNCRQPTGKSGPMPVKGIKLKPVQLGNDTIAKLSPIMTPDLNVVSHTGEMSTKFVVINPTPRGHNPNETPPADLRTPPTGQDSIDSSKRLSQYQINNKGVGACLVTSDAGGFLTLELDGDNGPRLLAMDEAKLTHRLKSLSRTTSRPLEAGFTPLVNIRIDHTHAKSDCNMAIFFNTLDYRYYIHVEQESLKVHPVPWDKITSTNEWMNHLFFSHSESNVGHDFPDAPLDAQKQEFESGTTPKSPITVDTNGFSKEPALIPYEETLEGHSKSAIEPFVADFKDTRRRKQQMSSDDSGISLGGMNESEGVAAVAGDEQNSAK